MTNPFLTDADVALGERFAATGHVVLPVEDKTALDRIRTLLVTLAAKHLGIEPPNAHDGFLNGFGDRVDAARLNDARLAVIAGMNATEWLRPAYYALARNALGALVGNELAMQRRINLSIQLPDDDSSLLPVHSDVWSGDSPFEIVLWVPFVDCRATKTMFLLPPTSDRVMKARFAEFGRKSAEDLYRAIEPELLWPELRYGEVMLFAQTLMHGNRVNVEGETRWSMNCRFKSVFSPYADKKLGEFFEPITLKPATRIALDYRPPEIGEIA
jgi:sporadic carbohydrate cluster 2OG-Fe(II) oxygenase